MAGHDPATSPAGSTVLDLPASVRLVEMLPRDGFQSLDRFVPTDEKVEIVDALSTTGVDEVEFSSFTHPDAVPNLRDAEAVAEGIERHDDVTYRALVPNAYGMERALAAGIDAANALVVVSDAYREKNQNMSLEENLEAVRGIVDLADDHGVPVEAGIGTSFFCPYEGEIAPERTISVVESVLDAGVDTVTLATTMGMATPKTVAELLTALGERWPDREWGLHLHDTNGMSLANAVVGMQLGVRRFDTALCGLGGGTALPASLQDVGNTPTEDLLNLLRQVDVATNADFERVAAVARSVADRLDLPANSHVLKGGTPENVLAAGGDGD